MAELLVLLRDWVRRDFQIRYTQTSLGALWALAQPITLTVTFVFLFRRIAGIDAPVPYASFVFPAMLLWTLFSAGVASGSNAMAGSMYIAAKANYPRIVAPLAAVLLPIVDLSLGLVLLPLLLLLQDAPGRFHPLPLFGALIGVLLLAAGLAVFFSALSIFIRDVRNVLPFGLQLMLLLTPVAYPENRLPGVLRGNPMATYVNGFRSSVLSLPGPDLADWLIAYAVSFAVLGAGLAYFHRVQGRFADVA